jgi:D-amino-acid dehydrogenase
MKLCILGSGVIGVTTAYALASRGHEVTVIERNSEAARECSFANGGQLSYSHAEPWANPGVFLKLWKWMFQEDAPLVLRPRADIHMARWGLLFLYNCLPARAKAHAEAHLRLGLYSKKEMQRIVEETGITFDRLEKGILHVFNSQKELNHAHDQMEFQAKLGCVEHILTRDQVLAMEPALQHSAEKIVGGVHAPMDESGDIFQFTQKLAALCKEKYGVTFEYGHHVRRLHVDHGKISHIETESGYISGYDAYVLSLGAYSPIYLRQVGLHVPIYPMKGYSITFPANEFSPTISLTDSARKVVYSRLGDRVRVAGTAEFAGYNDAVRKIRIDPIMRGVKALFPKADLSDVSEWACLRPSTPDGPPIVGSTPYSNLFVNTGHGTLGWTQAAGSAALLADVVDNKPTAIPLTGLNIERNLIRF